MLVFPSHSEINKMLESGVFNPLTGFETFRQDGGGLIRNFILLNGYRSTQRDKGVTYFDHKMPDGALKVIRSVTID